MSATDKTEHVSFGDTTILAGSVHRVDINSLLLSEVSNSWSRQGFSTESISIELLITWRCSCILIFNLVLYGNHVLGSSCGLYWCHGCGRLGGFCWQTILSYLINPHHDMADWDNSIITKSDLNDLASGS